MAAPDLIRRVQACIASEAETGWPTIDTVAGRLGIPRWTLQRRLKATRTSFAALVDATRRDLALRHLHDGTIPLTELALRLGYSELSAFTRAFRRWTGMPPQRFRSRGPAARGCRPPAPHPPAGPA